MTHQSLLSRLSSSLIPHPLPLAICAYFVVLALVYGRALPLFEATDEAAHFLYAHNLLETGQLPTLIGNVGHLGDQPPAVRYTTERHQPPLYYLGGALLISWTERADIDDYLQTNLLIFMRNIYDHNHHVWLHSPQPPSGDTGAAIRTLRLYSLALATGTLLLVYHAAKLAFGETRVALLAMALVASIPMYISLSGSVNNDNLVTLFYAAGVYWCLRMWRRGAIRWRDMLVIGLILSGAALAKLTGLTLFGVVFLALVIGGYRRLLPWRRVLLTLAVSLGVAAVLAGWWYLRNLNLYGDPFASSATLMFFGGYTPERAGLAAVVDEAARVWRTFWLGVGHLHALVYAPDWLYLYAGLVGLAAFVGIGLLWWRTPARRDAVLFLAAVFAVMLSALVAGTRDVDISYGRILYPALVAIAPLMAAGWLALLGRRLGPLLVLPLAAAALLTPVKYLPDAYPALQRVDALPPEARGVEAHAESLELLGYQLRSEAIRPGETLRLWLYIRGQHPDNPTLTVSLIDSLNRIVLGAPTVVYPGMAPTSQFNPDAIYRVQVDLIPDLTQARSFKPQRLSIAVGWSVPYPARTLAWTLPGGGQIGSLELDGPVWANPAYAPPAPQYPADVIYGDVIHLTGYSLSSGEVRAGETLTVTLHWARVADMDEDWTVAVGLLDDAGQVIASADGMPPGYPTSAWQPGTAFADVRALAVPDDAPPGDYRLYVGWYDLSDLQRLTPRGEGVEDTLFVAPTRITVAE